MALLDAYNSDKVRLQESIQHVHNTLKGPSEEDQSYRSIEEESGKLLYREEAVYRMASTLAVLCVLFTVYRVAR